MCFVSPYSDKGSVHPSPLAGGDAFEPCFLPPSPKGEVYNEINLPPSPLASGEVYKPFTFFVNPFPK